MKVAVVGGGMSGLISAYILAKEGVKVVVYEKEDRLGGHAKSVSIDGLELDIGFMVFNRVTYPNMVELLESLGVDMEPSDMSFSVSVEGYEWGTRNGFSSLLAQKKNLLNPYFWKLIREVLKFKDDCYNYLQNSEDIDRDETLEHFVKSCGYSQLFQKAFLIPTCASFWPCSLDVMTMSAYSILSFLRDHHALQIFGRPQWLTLRQHSQDVVDRVKKELEVRGCEIRTHSEVLSVLRDEEGCGLSWKDGVTTEVYDGCIIAAHAPDALKMLGKQATFDESRILGAFQFAHSDIFLHHDNTLMPNNPAAWSSLNFLETTNHQLCLTYWLNTVQNIGRRRSPFLLTRNPPETPKYILRKWSTSYPIPSVAAAKASVELSLIQGKRGIWFCGAYQGYGSYEDALKSGIFAAHNLLGKRCRIQKSPKHMMPSWPEAGARLVVTRFLQQFIATGCLVLLEEGGTVFSFKGNRKDCFLKVSLRIHTPQFYWKVATEGDLGIADAYINGDFSFVDENIGLLNLFLIFIANTELNTSASKLNKKRGWWTPLLFTSVLASAKYFFKHVLRQNTLTQARRNISHHYDLSNELFSQFLDETMTYSCAFFQSSSEDLQNAQVKKIQMLIEKARIKKEHHILEIGCGWGSFAIEAVKMTGCKYTGITLSEKQLQYAEFKVKEAGLQDRIKFVLCDYRQLSKDLKYDRIISCEMLEAVGHEYMEQFFKCCESVLAQNGVFVLQFISIADEKYDEFRLSQGFIKEYIFPGGCLPSLTRVTSAMAAASKLSVVQLEDIGFHYYQTLRCWREKFLQNQGQILALGFDANFIRTWEYYFDYCAAGFKSRILGDYQIVFTRPGDVAISGFDPCNPLSTTY